MSTFGSRNILARWCAESYRMNPEKNPEPLDGKRMIYGGFAPVVTVGK
jgi:uncharacterized protein YbaA (DUF1428 family)